MTMKRALVTGGAKRLGRAMALFLAGRGYDVAIHYVSSADAAQATAKEIGALGQRGVALQADLLQEDSVAHLLPRAQDALDGPLSLLINNASVFEHDAMGTITGESWDRHMGSNLRAPVFLTQEFSKHAPQAKADENGEPYAQSMVVNMVDQRVRKLTPEFMSYTLAKAGLWTFTQTAAQALAPHIRVNAIAPGPTLIGSRQSEKHFADQRAATVLGRGANPSDITGALGYLLDSPGVTGQLFCVDGGQHLGWQTPDVLGVE